MIGVVCTLGARCAPSNLHERDGAKFDYNEHGITVVDIMMEYMISGPVVSTSLVRTSWDFNS